MASTVKLSEYLDNIKALLRLDPTRWRIVVEKQVQAHVLPYISGTRGDLEPKLWELLILCLDGHQAEVPAITEESFEKACAAAKEGKSLTAEGDAAYPRAAVETALVMVEIREIGVYPPPKLSSHATNR